MSVSLCDIDGKGKRLSACLQAGKGFFSTGVSFCHVRLAFKVEKPSPLSTKSVAAGQQLLTSTEQNFFSALEIYFKALEIYFSGLEIYFKALEIYFSGLEIYFRATEKVLFLAARIFMVGR